METVTMETTTSARYIASDPAIRHSKPTSAHAHIPVADVPEQVESGISYEAIIEVALRDREEMRLLKASPQSHVRRPDWFRRWQHYDK